ncbi:HNH endonuclease family protein [Halomonas sp. KM007]
MAKRSQLALPGDWDDLTIEHLIPQARIDDGAQAEEIVGQMGNLLLVPSKLNEKLKDKPFKEKKAILLKEGYPLPKEIASADEWTAELVELRTEQIALEACQKIWRV